MRDGIKALNKTGVCGENLWPYTIGKFRNKPTANCYTDAAKHKIVEYYRINTLQDMKSCLAGRFPFVMGISVYDSFESDLVAKTGIVPMPNKNEQLLGGHAVMACGYDDTTKRFLVRNSWGINWGMKGYMTMDYDYLTNRQLSDDFWTIRRATGL